MAEDTNGLAEKDQSIKDVNSLFAYSQAEEATGTKEDNGMRQSVQHGTETNQYT